MSDIVKILEEEQTNCITHDELTSYGLLKYLLHLNNIILSEMIQVWKLKDGAFELRRHHMNLSTTNVEFYWTTMCRSQNTQ